MPPGPDVSATPRLLKLPLARIPRGADGVPVPVTLTLEPTAGGGVPCATPALATAGEALFVPVPAGRPVSELVIRLAGAPGTRLGAPEQVLLDGTKTRPSKRG
jgi:hypothetical protein